ncbi:MAG TPA: hypothetical protein GX497_03430 [Bacillus bacterium]|nr:hypothetical protein [Bacillus sp. (in: firmicutes)]
MFWMSLMFVPVLGAGLISDMFKRLFDLIWQAFEWLARFIKAVFQKLIDILVAFFRTIYMLIEGIFYFLYKIGVVAVKIFAIFFELGKLIVAIFVGFAKTLASLFYVSSSSGGNGYSDMLGKLVTVATTNLQLNVIAYVLLFLIWFVWVITAMKLISSIRVGGD